MKIAWFFPGQGSQSVGMGKDVLDASPGARAVFERADAALGHPLSRLILEGPEAELTLTANAQPAIVTMSIALLAAVPRARPEPRPPGVRRGALPRRVLGARGCRSDDPRRRGAPGAFPRSVDARSRAAGDGGDERHRGLGPGSRRGPLPASRRRRHRLRRKLQRPRPDRRRRTRRGGGPNGRAVQRRRKGARFR